ARFVNPALSGKWLEYEGWVLNDASHFVRETEDYKTKYSREAKSRKELAAKVDRLQGSNESPMIGQNPLVTQIKEKCLSVADSSIPILLTGETGTGKEVLAKFIHNTGKRKTKPFIKVDCSAIPATLIESALFGHEKGAFTGATDKKMGLFESANHGTLFLDEVGNIPLSVQVKLLGVLQDRLVTKVGGTTPVKLDIQIISATKESLKDLVRKEIFREDLYYRLNALVFELPPLRNRKDDIPLLCEHILSENVVNNEKRITILPETYRKLFNYSWPGNIRELRNVIHKAAIFCMSGSISPEDIEFQDINENNIKQSSRWEKIRSYTKDDWIKIITDANGNMSKAARNVGVTRKTVYDNVRKHKIAVFRQ
ncbi:MAG: sigma-54-dependent Fis family transcriptional regulator, partial [Fibrobacteres bacterium]|nr:sigma-54-dependent Fis family transcriptional regulator [Fibrobacterota bacterium]